MPDFARSPCEERRDRTFPVGVVPLQPHVFVLTIAR